MKEYKIDTLEQISPEYLEAWKKLHPQSPVSVIFERLEIGDVLRSDNILFEIKIGSDGPSSLNSGHYEDQLNRMVLWRDENFDASRRLVSIYSEKPSINGNPGYSITKVDLSRMATLCSERAIVFRYTSNPMHIWDIVYEDPRKSVQWVKPSQIDTRKLRPVAAALCAGIKGLSQGAADHLTTGCRTLEELGWMEFNAIKESLSTLYQKNMNALSEKVWYFLHCEPPALETENKQHE
jgi:hypothetical protein